MTALIKSMKNIPRNRDGHCVLVKKQKDKAVKRNRKTGVQYHTRPVTVIYPNGKQQTFDSIAATARALNCVNETVNKVIDGNRSIVLRGYKIYIKP